MSEIIPQELKYSKEHEWIKAEGKIAIIGITHHAQDQLGDVVYVELPAAGRAFTAGEEFGVVESVKSVSSLFCPVAGKVVEVNAELGANAQLVNTDPYGKGWMIKIEISDPAELGNLLSADGYKQLVEQ